MFRAWFSAAALTTAGLFTAYGPASAVHSEQFPALADTDAALVEAYGPRTLTYREQVPSILRAVAANAAANTAVFTAYGRGPLPTPGRFRPPPLRPATGRARTPPTCPTKVELPGP